MNGASWQWLRRWIMKALDVVRIIMPVKQSVLKKYLFHTLQGLTGFISRAVLQAKFNSMNLQFCGAARQVTGSSHLLTLDSGYKILLDCGLFQGSYQEDIIANSEFLFD